MGRSTSPAPLRKGGRKKVGGMDEHVPIPNRVEQRQVFSPLRRGGWGGELTISINLTLIDALFLRAYPNTQRGWINSYGGSPVGRWAMAVTASMVPESFRIPDA